MKYIVMTTLIAFAIGVIVWENKNENEQRN